MIVAEIGINHNGDVNLAKKMIYKAYQCGVKLVKFQKRNIDLCIPENEKNKIRETPWGSMTYYEYKKRLEFNRNQYNEIDNYCNNLGVKWFASVWDLDSVVFLQNYNVPYVKIPSACITDIDLLRKVSKCNNPIIISTGMSTIEEIDNAVNILNQNELIILACTSTYPTVDTEINLNKMKTLNERYNKKTGFSCHSTSVFPAILSLALDSYLTEVHITLDKNMWGTDQKSSLSSDDLSYLVKASEKIKILKGDGAIECYKSEEKVKKKLRKY